MNRDEMQDASERKLRWRIVLPSGAILTTAGDGLPMRSRSDAIAEVFAPRHQIPPATCQQLSRLNHGTAGWAMIESTLIGARVKIEPCESEPLDDEIWQIEQAIDDARATERPEVEIDRLVRLASSLERAQTSPLFQTLTRWNRQGKTDDGETPIDEYGKRVINMVLREVLTHEAAREATDGKVVEAATNVLTRSHENAAGVYEDTSHIDAITRLVLVAEHSTSVPLSTRTVQVNGKPWSTLLPALSYETVLHMAGFAPERTISVTWRHPNPSAPTQCIASGQLVRGQYIRVIEGLRINVADTSRA